MEDMTLKRIIFLCVVLGLVGFASSSGPVFIISFLVAGCILLYLFVKNGIHIKQETQNTIAGLLILGGIVLSLSTHEDALMRRVRAITALVFFTISSIIYLRLYLKNRRQKTNGHTTPISSTDS